MISLQVNGQNYQGFTDIDVTKSLENFCGTFSFGTTYQDVAQVPFSVGADCQVMVDGVLIITGVIDKIEVDYSASSHDIKIHGRDRTSDVLDSTIDGQFEINPPETLVGLTQKLLTLYKIPKIAVINQVGDLVPFTKDEIVSGHVGDTLYEVIEKYCRLRGVFCTTDANGNIVFTRASGKASGATLASVPAPSALSTLLSLGQQTTPFSNILRSSVTYDNSRRFYKYIAWSQANVAGTLSNEGMAPADIVSAQSEDTTDQDVRQSRTLNFVVEKAARGESLTDRAIWEANIRRSRGFEYKVTVQGHTKTGKNDPWMPNELVQVNDVFANIDAQLLVKSVRYSLSLGSGSLTELELVTKDSFTLQAQEDARQAGAAQEGNRYYKIKGAKTGATTGTPVSRK